MTTLVVLIRGINVGGARRVAMADLRVALERRGYANVRTVLASGNVVLDADEEPGELSESVAAVIADEFGHDVEVMVRTAGELGAVVEANPLADVATDASRYFVSFLSAEPERLPEDDFGEERFACRGRELYVWCPAGLRDSPLMKALSERALGVEATVRNWNTVAKLHELAQG